MRQVSLSDQERLAWLRLARAEGVGPVTFAYLMARFATAAAALDALPGLSLRGGRSAPTLAPPLVEGLQELEDGLAVGARLVAACEPEFPSMLWHLDPPPPLIWVLGDMDLLCRPAVAIVGARIASGGGQKFARELASDLGQQGQVIVSGMARGIDAAAHLGSLPTGTVAVLGGGVRDVYPQEHEDLYRSLRETGCILSESPPRHRAQARDFPRRNRLISGLSRAVVVVEAELKSGSLITARLAAEQGREVLAVPGSPLDPRSRGTNELIRQGASVCESAQDVMRALDGWRGVTEPGPASFDVSRDTRTDDGDLEALQEMVLGLLSHTPTSRDEIIRLSGAPARDVLGVLLELSLSGRAELLAGGGVVLT